MSQPNPGHKSQKQENIVKDTTVGGDFTFAPQQIETYIETQIVKISAEKVTQQQLIKASPYKGLKRFNQSDRQYFFGRDALIAKLLNAVNKSSFSLILGASGSGKSSIVRAGLIPELKKYFESKSSQKFYDLILTPNQDPFESLHRCLLNGEKDYSFGESDVEFIREKKPIILKNWLAGETKRWLEVKEKNKFQASDELLKGSRLEQIVEFREKNAFEKLGGLVPEENEFIDASTEYREQEKERAKRRQRQIIVSLTTGLITLSILAVAAIWQSHKSTISEINALSNSSEALLTSHQELEALITGLKAGRKIQNSLFGVDQKIEIKLLGRLQNIFYQVKEFNRLADQTTAKVQQAVFSSDSQTIASIGHSNTIKLLNLRQELLYSLNAHRGGVSKVIFSPNGQNIASVHDDGTTKLWNLNGKLLHSFDAYGDSVFSPDGQTLALTNNVKSISNDKSIKLWNAQGKLLSTLKGYKNGVFTVTFSPDSKMIVSIGDDHKAKLWNTQGKLLHTFNNGDMSNIVFSPDGKTFAATLGDSIVSLWNIEGKLLQTFSGHTDDIINIVFSSDGQTLASASWDRTVKLWNIKGELLVSLNGHQDWIQDMALSPDGQTLASASDDQTIKLWSLDLDNVLKRGCNWVQGYLANNPNVSEQDRQLCQSHE